MGLFCDTLLIAGCYSLSLYEQAQVGHFFKFLILCSEKERREYDIRTTQGGENGGLLIFIFEGTIPMQRKCLTITIGVTFMDLIRDLRLFQPPVSK